MLLHEDLTYKIIGAAMEVHRRLGPGFLESVYEEAFSIELNVSGSNFESQKELRIWYRDGFLSKTFRVNFVVEGKVIVELKAVKELSEVDEAQLINYLKISGLKVGLLFNFGEASLKYIRRVFEENP